MKIKKTTKTAMLKGIVENSLSSNSETNAPSVNAVKDGMNGKVLYEDTSGTGGNVPLNDDLSNYKYIEVYTRDKDVSTIIYPVRKFEVKIGNSINIFTNSVDTSKATISNQRYTMNTNELTRISYWVWQSTRSPFEYVTQMIYKVVGYK